MTAICNLRNFSFTGLQKHVRMKAPSKRGSYLWCLPPHRYDFIMFTFVVHPNLSAHKFKKKIASTLSWRCLNRQVYERIIEMQMTCATLTNSATAIYIILGEFISSLVHLYHPWWIFIILGSFVLSLVHLFFLYKDYHFIIYDLRFDCRYLIRLQSVSQQGAIGPVVHTTISTPFCHQVTIVGEIKPDCPRNGMPVDKSIHFHILR